MKQTTKHLNDTKQQYQKFLTITLVLIVSLLVLCQTTHAQDAIKDNSLKSYKMPKPHLKKYFEDKYKDEENKTQLEDISSNLQETPQGPRGKLHLSGHIRPKNVEAMSGDKFAHARAIAMAFLKEEAEVLGFPDLNEMRERKIEADMGHDGEYTHIHYDRYIGDVPFKSGNIHIVIGPDDSISYVYASLLPVPSETYQAVTKKTITEDDVLKIVKRDLKAHGSDPDTMKVKNNIEKFASDNPPYVFWGLVVTDRHKTKTGHWEGEYWEYIINAFTGDIHRKTDKSRTAE